MATFEIIIFLTSLAAVLVIGLNLIRDPQGEIASAEARVARDGDSVFENNHPSSVAMRTPRATRLSGVFLIVAAVALFLVLNPWF